VVVVVVAPVVVVGPTTVVTVVLLEGALSCPTVIVTVDPCGAEPEEGDCAMTRPAWVGSLVAPYLVDHMNPAFCSADWAAAWLWPTTLGMTAP
jgi:hypothetical protein